MKQHFLGLALLCNCLLGMAQNRPVNYQFTPNDTISFLKVKIEDSGEKDTTLHQLIVCEADATYALLKFNNPIEDETELIEKQESEKSDFHLDSIQAKFKLASKILSPIILYKDGVAKKVQNKDEIQSCVSDMLDLVDELLEEEDSPDTSNDTLRIVLRLFKPALQRYFSEQAIIQDHSNLVISYLPKKLGKGKNKDGRASIRSKLSATETDGEYVFEQTIKKHYTASDLKDAEVMKNESLLSAISSVPLLGDMFISYIDSYRVEINKTGIVFANGTPKTMQSVTKITYTMMGESTTDVTKEIVRFIPSGI